MESRKHEAVSVTLPEDLLACIDRRAAELDLNRSQYLRRLARQDLEQSQAANMARQEAPQEVSQ